MMLEVVGQVLLMGAVLVGAFAFATWKPKT
jgi:hypothetical protein